MHPKKIFMLILLALVAKTGYAQENRVISENPELNLPIMQKQIKAKQIYREAYEHDNDVKFSTLEELEHVIANNPGLDDDLMAVVKRGTALYKTMDFGMYQDNMEQAGLAFDYNPTASLKVIRGLSRTNATPQDVLAVTDMIDVSERLKEKMLKGDELGSTGYQINIDDF